MIEAVNPLGVWSPFGAFSMAVIEGTGQIVYLKGQVALNEQGQVVGKGDMRMQTRKTLENIRVVCSSDPCPRRGRGGAPCRGCRPPWRADWPTPRGAVHG